jgi:hypothetical protein
LKRIHKIYKKEEKGMKSSFLRLLVMLVMVVAMLMTALPVFGAAGTTQDVTVTAAPKFLAIEIDNLTWTINGLTGAGVIDPSTTYYSNPLGDTTSPTATVVDGECRFSVDNTSSVHTNLKLHWHNFGGGSANMLNKDSGAADATHFAGYFYLSGALLANKVQVTVADVEVKHDLGETTDIKFGLQIDTQTGAWAGGSASTATVTMTVEAHT